MKTFSDQQSTPLLIATTELQRQKIFKTLGDHFDLSFVSTMKEAQEVLERGNSPLFSLVICSIDFDESRMFDLLRFIRTSARLKTLPFVAISVRHPSSLYSGTARSAMELMGSGFVELTEHGDDSEEQNLLDTILMSLMKTNLQERVSAE